MWVFSCFWLSVITDIIIWSSHFDSVPGFLCLMHRICVPVASTLSDVDLDTSIWLARYGVISCAIKHVMYLFLAADISSCMPLKAFCSGSFAYMFDLCKLTVETVQELVGFSQRTWWCHVAWPARHKVCNLTINTLGTASHNILKQAKQYAIVSTSQSFTKDTEHRNQIEFGTSYGMQLS